MRGKKALLLVTLTLFLGAIIASTPVKADPAVTLTFRHDGVDGQGDPIFLPPAKPGGFVNVIIDIDAPKAWDNTPDGIIGWGFTICVSNPTALQPYDVVGATPGAYLRDFCDFWGYGQHAPAILVGGINDTCIYQIAEMILGWKTLGVGAGGPSGDPSWTYGMSYGLVNCRFRGLSLTVCSRIYISDAVYFTANGDYEGFAFDSIEWAGFYVENPCLLPEFPLGVEVAAGIGLMAAVVYIWLRKRKTNPIAAKRFTTPTTSQ